MHQNISFLCCAICPKYSSLSCIKILRSGNQNTKNVYADKMNYIFFEEMIVLEFKRDNGLMK